MKKGILVVSFGTTHPDTRRLTIEAIERRIEKAFPDYSFYRAFTSGIIIKKMKEREGILGEEYYVDMVNVKVLDRNDNQAAVEGGALDKESRIIVSSTKEIGKGDTVRWEDSY